MHLRYSLLCAIAIPFAFTAIGIFVFRKRPADLLRMFYGIELPLFFLCLARLFLVRQMTLPQTVLGACAAIGIAAFALSLRERPLFYGRVASVARLVGHTVLMSVCLYIGTLLFFSMVPVVWQILAELITFEWVGELARELFSRPHHAFIAGLGITPFSSFASGF